LQQTLANKKTALAWAKSIWLAQGLRAGLVNLSRLTIDAAGRRYCLRPSGFSGDSRFSASDSEKIYVGKERQKHTLPQESINTLLADLAKAGKRVVRLKGEILSFLVAAARKLKH